MEQNIKKKIEMLRSISSEIAKTRKKLKEKYNLQFIININLDSSDKVEFTLEESDEPNELIKRAVYTLLDSDIDPVPLLMVHVLAVIETTVQCKDCQKDRLERLRELISTEIDKLDSDDVGGTTIH